MTVHAPKDRMVELVTSQINFGLAYAREARAAYESARTEYGDLARDIADKAYAAAVRFAAKAPNGIDPSTSKKIEELETELYALWRPQESRTLAIA